jgi:Ca2+-binding RTX toxin-like protein
LPGIGTVEDLIYLNQGGTGHYILPDHYVGPVIGLTYQVLGSAAAEVALGTGQNDFFNLLGGDDALDAGAGNDVLDGGTGSNFLSGGAGIDTFFLDGRGGTSTWSTITDWEAGEQLSVFGWKPGVSKVLWVASDGAPGYKGVTMHGDLDGNGLIDTSVTWTGRTQADLPTPLEFNDLLWFV